MAKINFVNIGIVLILVMGGAVVSFQDGQHDKAAVAAGITKAGSAVSAIAPSSSISEAMPAIAVNQTTNSIAVSSGLNLLMIAVCLAAFLVMMSFMRCVSCFAKC